MRRFPLLLAPLVITGCATADEGRFPSLARRDAERVSGIAQPVAAIPRPTLVPAATAGSLAELREQALAAHRDFGNARGRAAALTAAASGAAVGSESWAVAQVALAELEGSRSAAMIALADLDSLSIAAARASVPTGGSAELDAVLAVHREVSAWIAEEDTALAALHGRLRN